MRINNNISAMNTSRQLGILSGRLSRSMERLSSGLRIARAADDAAGLAVSEKLRGQIRGVQAAVRAQQDSVSGLQVAEGALNEVSSMLTRAKELGIQRGGTSDSDALSAIDAELKQIFTEIDNVETNTEYNGVKLFSGSGSFSIYTDINGTTTSLSIATLNLVAVGTAHTDAQVFSIDSDGGTSTDVWINEVAGELVDLEYSERDDGSDGGTTAPAGGAELNWTLVNVGTSVFAAEADNEEYITQEQFSSNIVKATTYAINEVATLRGQIGSYQNRFEASIRNFEATAENLQAAESRIRDVDMAKEMVMFTKDTIIQQAAQAMLVQANQLPQNIVGLLR
jgi:flagellin